MSVLKINIISPNKMITYMRIFSVVILFFLALNAIGGSLFLMVDSSGEAIQFPIELLEGTPFNNYLIPGIILFIFIGILSIATALMVIKEINNYPWFICFQGIVLICWLLSQLSLNLEFFTPILHLPLLFAGIILISIGIIFQKAIQVITEEFINKL